MKLQAKFGEAAVISKVTTPAFIVLRAENKIYFMNMTVGLFSFSGAGYYIVNDISIFFIFSCRFFVNIFIDF